MADFSAKKKPPDADNDATARERLIQVAARHFADHGFEGASLRAIQREADVNSAATHYYFGSKQELYREVVRTFLQQIQAERARRLDGVSRTLTGEARLRAIVSAYVRPHIELALSEAGYPYGRILARVLIEPRHDTNVVFDELIRPLRERLIGELRAIFPDRPTKLIDRAISLVVMMMADAPYNANWFASDEKPARKRASDARIEEIERFMCAGILSLCRNAWTR